MMNLLILYFMSKIFSCIHLLNFITKMKREKTFAICY